MYVFIDIDTNSSTCIMQYPHEIYPCSRITFALLVEEMLPKINRNIFGHNIQK